MDKPDQDTAAGVPAEGEKPAAVITKKYVPPDKPVPSAKDRGGRGGSPMNLENLSNGNPAGGATPDHAGEATFGAGLSIPGGHGATTSAGTFLLARRFGLFPGAEGGLLAGGGLYSGPGASPPPQFLLGTFHAANQAGSRGIFLQAGALRDPAKGSYTYAGGLTLAATRIAGQNGEFSLYPNLIYNTAGTGQVSNANVTTYNSATLLFGVADTPVQRDMLGEVVHDEEGKPVSTPNTFGAEAAITGNAGGAASPGDRGVQKSLTATGLLYYQRALGSTALGVAVGGTYETGGGGWGAFVRVGIGMDWRSQSALSNLVPPLP